jgi:hypothetical protein
MHFLADEDAARGDLVLLPTTCVGGWNERQLDAWSGHSRIIVAARFRLSFLVSTERQRLRSVRQPGLTESGAQKLRGEDALDAGAVRRTKR